MIATSLISNRHWRLAWLALSLLVASHLAAYGGMLLRGMGKAPASGYTDFCSTPNVSCAIALSVEQRLVSTAPATAYVLTRFSDSATQNIGYVGSTFKADTATAQSFCLGNGGTTTLFTPANGSIAYTQYNDCGISQINDQTANGCNPSQATQINMPPFDVRADGKPASISPTPVGGHTASGAKWLAASGCTAPCPGTAARTAIVRINTIGFSECCGTFGGCAENVFGVVTGTMYAVDLYTNSAHTFNSFGCDVEGGGCCNDPAQGLISYPPPGIDVVGLVAYNGTTATNIYFNGTQTATNCAPYATINSQQRFLIGTAGDGTSSNPTYIRSIIFTSNDVAATAGLAAQIYNYLNAL